MDIFCDIMGFFLQDVINRVSSAEQIVLIGFRNSMHACISWRRCQTSNAFLKYNVLKTSALNNMFVETELKNLILDLFGKSQRRFIALLRMRRKMQFKYGRRYTANTDMSLTPLDTIQPNLLLHVIENSTRYTFRLSDLAVICTTALSNSDDMFSVPKKIRNPYTNLPFSVTSLVTIFMTLEDSSLKTPIIFRLFADSGFDLSVMELKFDSILREHAIDDFLKIASYEQKHHYLFEMFQTYEREFTGIKIHPSFPVPKICEGLGYLLPLYLRSSYSLSQNTRSHYRGVLRNKILHFVGLNPTWGRLIIVQPDIHIKAGRRVITEEHDSSLANYSVVVVKARNDMDGYASLDGQWVDVVFKNAFTTGLRSKTTEEVTPLTPEGVVSPIAQDFPL